MDTLKANLSKIGIDVTSLSKRELETLSKIQTFYDEYVEKNNSIRTEIQNNSFTRSSIKDAGICSRQTLYKNEVINQFVEYLIENAEQIQLANSAKYVSKLKYDELKNENQKLILNAINVAEKNVEIEKLIKENKQLKERIDNLLCTLEEEKNENKRLKMSRYA